MERPVIKDKDVLKYVDFLEKQINNYSSDTTIAKLYLAYSNKVNNLTDILNEIKLKIRDMSDKDDRMFDRYFKIQDNVLSVVKDLKEFDTLVNPKIVEQLKQEVGSDYEKRLNMLNNE